MDELAFHGLLTAEQRRCLPNWLIVAPPKTGSTWLSDKLSRHPQVFLARGKELRYFSSRFDGEDLHWYLAQFHEVIGKVKGEASPSYSLLPQSTIRLIRKMTPDLKLIYLMRDPVERARSHARHCFRYREANFRGHAAHIEAIADSDWLANMYDDWNRLSGDYLGQLQRWVSVFPKEQVLLGFFEDIVNAPRPMLRRVLDFLGVDSRLADSAEVTMERVNVGVPRELPPGVEPHLQRIHGARTRVLAAYLAEEFGLEVPDAWQRTLEGGLVPHSPAPEYRFSEDMVPDAVDALKQVVWDVDDSMLKALLAREDPAEWDFVRARVVALENSRWRRLLRRILRAVKPVASAIPFSRVEQPPAESETRQRRDAA